MDSRLSDASEGPIVPYTSTMNTNARFTSAPQSRFHIHLDISELLEYFIIGAST